MTFDPEWVKLMSANAVGAFFGVGVICLWYKAVDWSYRFRKRNKMRELAKQIRTRPGRGK